MSRITSLSALAALSLGLIAAPLAYAQGGATTTPDTKASAATTQAAPATETAKAPAKAKSTMKASASKAAAMAKVDINSAAREDLMKLAGIGDATADKIIAERPFKTKKDLLTKGLVTKAQFAKISGHIIAKQETSTAGK